MYMCLSARQTALFFRRSIKFNKILRRVCLPPPTIPFIHLPSGQNATAPNIAF